MAALSEDEILQALKTEMQVHQKVEEMKKEGWSRIRSSDGSTCDLCDGEIRYGFVYYCSSKVFETLRNPHCCETCARRLGVRPEDFRSSDY